jgi:hypothetical protein
MEIQNPLRSQPNDYLWNATAKAAYDAQVPHRNSVLGFYSSILIPICAIGSSLVTRCLHRLRRYCVTKAEDRYEIVHTRAINLSPQLLDLIEDNIEPIPSQEEIDNFNL